MAPRTSAGLLLHRASSSGDREVLLGHMGGPFWARKDAAAWSIPKGELEPGEDPLDAARREFTEELGAPAPTGVVYAPLGEIRQSGGKVVVAWAVASDFDAGSIARTDHLRSSVELEWPPRSGRIQIFPEIDRAGWFTLDEARERLVTGQRAFLDRLVELPD